MNISTQSLGQKLQYVSLLLVFTFCAFSIYAQTPKTYNGVFKTSNLNGNASYQYFDNTEGERTYDGTFKFSSSNNLVAITGKYEKNLKSGLWKYTLTNYLYSDMLYNYVINATATGSYLNGQLHGNWNIQRTKTVSMSNSGVSNYYKGELNSLSYLLEGKNIDFSKKQTVAETSTANFSQNRFSGTFIYSVNNGKSKVTGQFDSNGFMQGTWIALYFNNGIPVEQRRTYLHGVLMTVKTKDVSTGELVTNLAKETEVNEFFQNYNEAENSSIVDGKYYFLKSQKPNSDGSIIDKALSMWVNNTSISNSSYAYEVKQGVIAMADFPQRTISYDEDKNRQKERDDEEKAEKLRRKKEAEEEEKRQIQIAKENQERKARYEEERKRMEFERSDFGQLKKQIKLDFSAWLEKKEFETIQQYENRIKSTAKQEFEKLLQAKVEASKERYLGNILSATLKDYNIENQTFLVKIYSDYGAEFKTEPVYINVPANIAENLKSKFGSNSSAQHGRPLAVHVLNVTMIGNKWTPSKLLIIFPNGEQRSSSNFNKAYYDGYYWNQTRIKESGDGQYILNYTNGVSLKPIKLKNLTSEFKSSSLDNGIFFYEWQLKNTQTINFDLTIENLGIELPFKN